MIPNAAQTTDSDTAVCPAANSLCCDSAAHFIENIAISNSDPIEIIGKGQSPHALAPLPPPS